MFTIEPFFDLSDESVEPIHKLGYESDWFEQFRNDLKTLVSRIHLKWTLTHGPKNKYKNSISSLMQIKGME